MRSWYGRFVACTCGAWGILGGSPSWADPAAVKENVVIVRPQYHEETRKEFEEVAQSLDTVAREVNKPELKDVIGKLAASFRRQAASPGFGSGWLWVSPHSRGVFAVTNKHVVRQADSVTLQFASDKYPPVPNCRVVYVADDADVALIEIPRGAALPRKVGFEFARTAIGDAAEVIAVGFPASDTLKGVQPLFDFRQGHVVNAEYPSPEPNGRPVIATDASIDPGNSGGPLIVPAPTAKLGYRVVGMNTWKSVRRSNLSMAIPVSHIELVLRAAEAARDASQDPGALKGLLRSRADQLSFELGSARPNLAKLNSMMSYSFVARHAKVLHIATARMAEMKKEEMESFLDDPVEYCRIYLWSVFLLAFKDQSRLGNVQLGRIADDDIGGVSSSVRTQYVISGRTQEFTWTWEHGSWRIADASFENALDQVPAQQEDRKVERSKPAVQQTSSKGASGQTRVDMWMDELRRRAGRQQ